LQQQRAHVRIEFDKFRPPGGCRDEIEPALFDGNGYVIDAGASQKQVVKRAFRREAQQHVKVGQTEVAVHEQ